MSLLKRTPYLAGQGDLARLLAAFRREFFWVGVFSLAINLLMLSPTLYMLQVYDRVMISQNEVTLIALTLIILLFYFIMAFAEWLRSRLLVRISVRLEHAINERVFYAGFAAHLKEGGVNPGEALTDMTHIRQFLTGYGIVAFFDFPWAPVYLAVLFLMHPVLGWTGVALTLLQLGLAYHAHQLNSGKMVKMMEASQQLSRFLSHKLRNAELIKSLGMVGNLRARWQARHLQQLEVSQATNASAHNQQHVMKFFMTTNQSLTLAIAAYLVIEGELTMGAMVAANMLLARAVQPMQMIVGGWKGFVMFHEAYHRLHSVLEKYPDTGKGVWPVAADAVPRGEVTLNNVSAVTERRSRPIVDHLSLTFKAGEVVVLMGASGAGKSTLAKVLVGIWPDVQGDVRFDGVPLADWDRSRLGPYLGYLPQDTELLEGSVAENICRFGEVNTEQIVAVAKLTGIHDMILRLPRGYDTSVGEAGRILSGGQRQRLALARAFYGHPKWVVLDEPNAHLDDAGEQALMNAIRQMKTQGCGIVVVSHRPGLIQVADRVLVLSRGQLEHDWTPTQALHAIRARPVAAPAAPVTSIDLPAPLGAMP